MKEPEILEEIKDAAYHLVRKWGPHDVEVELSGTDRAKIQAHAKQNPKVFEEPEGQSFSIQLCPKPGIPEGTFKAEIQKDDDEKDGDLIEV